MRLVLALLAVLALTSCQQAKSTGVVPRAYHGLEPSPVPSRPEFVLHDTSGAIYDFRSQTAGHPTFVYFGYTNCPDECPTAMADVAAALRKATPEARAAARVVFVTTDPARDSGAVLRRWLDQFGSGFVGLRGTQAEVDAAETATGIPVAKPEGVAPTLPGHPDQHPHKAGTAPHKHFGPLGYAVTHSALIFAYDAANRLPVAYPGGVTPSEIAADLPALLHP